jgi:class 3 adenylate cyclase
MARLAGRKRSTLPDRAFAYIDSRGRRRLPINDESHVRNALARFNQVVFEDDHTRERARKRLLTAAKKYGIVPIGFITGQLRAERDRLHRQVAARAAAASSLPSGFVTLLMTDIENSTALLHRAGARYGALLNTIRRAQRTVIFRHRGREIDARADEFFAVFEDAGRAVAAAVAAQRTLSKRAWPGGLEVRIRMGIHSGRPTLTKTGYIGLPVHTVARVCAAAHGGQIIISGETRLAVERSAPAGFRFRALGRRRLTSLPNPVALFQVEAEGLTARFPPPRTWKRGKRLREPATGAAPTEARAGIAQLHLGLDREE